MAAFAAGLLGCSGDRSDDRSSNRIAGGGGFETGNIQARVTTPSGLPADRAMVWLVVSQGDTAPARVLDSGLTDALGIAHLDLPSDANRTSIGVDAKLDDSLGISKGCLSGSDSLSLRLSPSGTAEAWIDSSRQIPLLFVPGSHFRSERAVGVPKSALRLPQGAWDIAVKTETSTEIWRRTEIGPSIKPIGTPAWSTKNLDWDDSLQLPKLITLDSVLYRDPALATLDKWQPLQGTIDGIIFSSNPTISRFDSSIFQVGYYRAGSGLEISSLPPIGALRSNFGFEPSSPIDSELVRAITIRNADQSGGLRIVMDPRAKNPPTIEYLGESGESAFVMDPVNRDPIQEQDWIVVWDRKYFSIVANGALIACAYRGMIDGSPPLVQFQAYSASKATLGSIQLSRPRLYQPK